MSDLFADDACTGSDAPIAAGPEVARDDAETPTGTNRDLSTSADEISGPPVPEVAPLWDRSIAGLLDLVPISLLFFGMSNRSGIGWTLAGSDVLVFVLAWLGYYFVSESVTGTTFGKAILSLQVRGVPGGPLTTRSVAIAQPSG